MPRTNLADIYRGYIACLNAQDWPSLGQFVHADAHHNGRRLGLSGYQAMLERDFAAIPDLRFENSSAGLRPAVCGDSAGVRLHAGRNVPRPSR